jgi:DNA polymerase elongation subunit (family B)
MAELASAALPTLARMHAGFEAAVAAANGSELGRRNGGAMLAGGASERALLQNLLARLRALDADVYCGHNIAAFDLDVLLHRLQAHKARRNQFYTLATVLVSSI